ncbi:ABC transporter substrate-binding protein [Schaalia suimastitidis]|uniref:ABC transporter substrate-binding protein n=1 Tax=Schaalia suimastitidis TaxID=121163 RepID=UPI000426DEA8|nr:ABC transporter substrate-binding protein [Schaalia suimastitidis]
MPRRALLTTSVTALIAIPMLAACGTAETLTAGEDVQDTLGAPTIVVGSQDYYSNEILAEAYATALENAGYSVKRDLRIGQREVYISEISAGKIDLLPEYSGNLLQYFDANATQRSAEDVYDALTRALPEGMRVLAQAEASDQDSYVVTKALAQAHGLETIDDLRHLDSVTLGGNAELEQRPYGPAGLLATYGVAVNFTPIEDSGGALTVKALRGGQIQLANIYSADPVLAAGDLVVLKDTKNLFLASHVVPLVSDKVDAGAAEVINRVSAALSAQDLIDMNQQSVSEGLPAAAVARQWLEREGVL